MSESELDTSRLDALVRRIRDGDSSARDELLRPILGRLGRLARRMLARFPDVRRWEQSGDVLNDAVPRLLRALEEVRPASTRDFFNLAAVQVRRVLLDLARHYRGPAGPAALLGGAQPVGDPPAPSLDNDLDRWQAFHEALAQLPTAEREVVDLRFYHGWTHDRIAELLGLDKRTVRRRWQSACIRLKNQLGDEMPES
jgi:RNA polymerase sigma factor (sigma-70 family)